VPLRLFVRSIGRVDYQPVLTESKSWCGRGSLSDHARRAKARVLTAIEADRHPEAGSIDGTVGARAGRRLRGLDIVVDPALHDLDVLRPYHFSKHGIRAKDMGALRRLGPFGTKLRSSMAFVRLGSDRVGSGRSV